MSDCGCQFEAKNREQRRVLVALLLINALMFVVEFGLGMFSQSTALIADSLDMLADATVYGIGLYAVGRAPLVKIKAANLSGWFQILLGLLVLADVLRRLWLGSDPLPWYMMIVGTVALVANVICLKLLARHRDGEVHMRASWVFSKNDVIANLGVIAGGALVLWLGSPYPDLFLGFVICTVVVRGGFHILKDAASERRQLSM